MDGLLKKYNDKMIIIVKVNSNQILEFHLLLPEGKTV